MLPSHSPVTRALTRAGALLAGVAVAAGTLVTAGEPAADAAPADPAGTVSTAGRWLVDEQGRVVITHGVNLVAKHAPYTPASMGFDARDADLLAAEGFDSVRLGIIWKAVEPRPGIYDDAYLSEVRQTVRLLHSRGIRVLLDSHQDLYNERFQGEFAPDWAVTVHWPAVPQLGFPGNMFLQPALLQQYEDFFHNVPGPGGVGLLDRYAAMWGHVAAFFTDEPNLLGYDILNEPMPGYNWAGCFTEQLCGGHAARLGDLHRKAGRAIRAADPHTPVFYEPYATSNPGSAVHAPAPGVPGQALSFHSYCAPAITLGVNLGCDFMDDNTIARAQASADRAGAPALLTEFGAKKNPETITPVVRAAERRMVGWQYWAYCDCGDPTTSGPGEQGIIPDAHVEDPAAAVDPAKLAALAAPRPTALAGVPLSYGFDPATGVSRRQWESTRADGGPAFGAGADTVITVPRRQYPGGYRVTVDGGHVVSAPGADQLVIRADRGGRLAVTVTR